MTYLSLIDKLKILFSTLFDFKGIFIFSILMIIFTILYLTKKINAKRYTVALSLSILFTFILSFLSNKKELSNTFDNFTTVFFTGIYFPSIYLYLSTLAIVLISFIVSTINIKIKRVYKIINRIMFVLNCILFILMINVVAKNKIDIFSINSLYTNNTLVVMLEISMGLFLIWIASLGIAYITNAICDRIVVKKQSPIEVATSLYDKENSYALEEKITNNVYLEQSNSITIVKYLSSYIPKPTILVHDILSYCNIERIRKTAEDHKEVIEKTEEIKEESSLGITFDDILNGRIPVAYYDVNGEDNLYSISNPQEVYESHYNSVKYQDIKEEALNNNLSIKKEEIVQNNNMIKENNIVIENASVIDTTNEIKSERAAQNLAVNTISLNELVDADVLEDIKVIDKVEKASTIENYTIDDYKKIIGMLNSLKKHSAYHNVTIDDAVALSLISNYSMDDCLKFKDILESTLN